MKSKKLITAAGLFLFCQIVYGQTILQQYFNGNKDSMQKEAFRLINLPSPMFHSEHSTGRDEQYLRPKSKSQSYKVKDCFFTMRDNKKIYAGKFSATSGNTIILIHGVGTDGSSCFNTADLLRKATGAEVYAIDLRGHGKSEGRDGDVDYIDQYADDVEDIVNAIRKSRPAGKVIVAGHSMGGGVTLQYARHTTTAAADGYILLAPLIGQNSPAIRQGPPAGTNPGESFMQIDFAKIIGLKMFNELNDHSHDSLPVLFLNLPENSRARKYSYRANMSSAPEDYITGLKALTQPALVLIGTADEVFDAATLKKAVQENSAAQVVEIELATHNSLLYNPDAIESIKKWFTTL